MALTTCKECRKAVAADASTCPHCGVSAPGEGGDDRNAAAKALSDKTSRQVAFGCGGFVLLVVLLIGGGALWNALTAVELDKAAEDACSAVTTAEFGDGAILQGAGRVRAVAYALESDAEGLQEAAGDGPLNPETVSTDYFAVAAWCEEHAE